MFHPSDLMAYDVQKLLFGRAAAAEAKDLDQRLRQIKAARYLPSQQLEVNEITRDVLHRFAARADQVMMRFEIAVHPQGGCMRSDLSQQPTVDEKAQVVIDGGERNGWNPTPNGGVNCFRGMVPVGSNHGLKDDLPLVRHRQTALRRQFAELLVGNTHNYWRRMIIKQFREVST